jgi:hypothetical protein
MLAEGERRAAVWRGEEGGGVERREGRRAQLGREGRGLGFWGWEADYIWRRVGGLQVGQRWGVVGQNFCRERTNMALGKETILIKLIIKNSKLMEKFSKI